MTQQFPPWQHSSAASVVPGGQPGAASGYREQQATIDGLRAQVRSLRILAFGGVALGLMAVALSSVALSRATQPTVIAQPAATTAAASPAPAAPAPAAPAPAAPATIGTPADAGAAPAGTIVLGSPGKGNPVVDVYEDFQCPACASVERTFGPQVDALVASGTVEVRYHVMSFLDTNLRNDSSVRSANGGFCAHDQGKFMAWHDTLFAPANRPKEEGDGWTDAQLKAFAGTAGVDVDAWSSCVASGKHLGAVAAAEQTSMASGVNSTPTYKLNGTKLDLTAVVQAGGLVAFVDAHR